MYMKDLRSGPAANRRKRYVMSEEKLKCFVRGDKKEQPFFMFLFMFMTDLQADLHTLIDCLLGRRNTQHNCIGCYFDNDRITSKAYHDDDIVRPSSDIKPGIKR